MQVSFECFVNDTVSRFCGGLARLPLLAKRRFAFIAIWVFVIVIEFACEAYSGTGIGYCRRIIGLICAADLCLR